MNLGLVNLACIAQFEATSSRQFLFLSLSLSWVYTRSFLLCDRSISLNFFSTLVQGLINCTKSYCTIATISSSIIINVFLILLSINSISFSVVYYIKIIHNEFSKFIFPTYFYFQFTMLSHFNLHLHLCEYLYTNKINV